MNPMLEQFLFEARESVLSIGQLLMRLEVTPEDEEVMAVLFRIVHTLKGNSGLFDFPELPRVLHEAESLMDAVRHGEVAFSKDLADRLLEAMDFVGLLCDEIGAKGHLDASYAVQSARMAESLRSLLAEVEAPPEVAAAPRIVLSPEDARRLVAEMPLSAQDAASQGMRAGGEFNWLEYSPVDDCFFQGDDPFFQARGTPGLLWATIESSAPTLSLADMDLYRCCLVFRVWSIASRAELDTYYRFVPDQISVAAFPADCFAAPDVEPFAPDAEPVHAITIDDDSLGAGQGIDAAAEVSLPGPASGPAVAAVDDVADEGPASDLAGVLSLVEIQSAILRMPLDANGSLGRTAGVVATLRGCLRAIGFRAKLPELEAAAALAIREGTVDALVAWLGQAFLHEPPGPGPSSNKEHSIAPSGESLRALRPETAVAPSRSPMSGDSEMRFGRRAEDSSASSKTIKVDQAKIDRLMNLIGEMVVSKNALPYLAGRAEHVFGVRDLSREIKSQYAVINRIAEELQDAIMQVRMMPMSFVMQRFPRLVRDISRKLGKEVHLVLEGEDTEADKAIVEALGDPLVHIVRNSLDHGIELPDVRIAAGKPAAGTLQIRVRQIADRVHIDIRDDGKGIDPAVIKQKALEKGLIDEATFARITDQDALSLIFAPGFSTMDVVSELSGRGVGMDVVKTAVENVHGVISVESEKGKGTTLRVSLPLSLAVTNVMIVESAGQRFGVPLASIVETVRMRRSAIRLIKQSQITVLRNSIASVISLNQLLNLSEEQLINDDDELALLFVRHGDERVGLIVDEVVETSDIILKPMAGVLTGLAAYAGSALMGDGSVLMVLNVEGLLSCQ